MERNWIMSNVVISSGGTAIVFKGRGFCCPSQYYLASVAIKVTSNPVCDRQIPDEVSRILHCFVISW